MFMGSYVFFFCKHLNFFFFGKGKVREACLQCSGKPRDERSCKEFRCTSSHGGIKMHGDRSVVFQGKWEAGKMSGKGQRSSGKGMG